MHRQPNGTADAESSPVSLASTGSVPSPPAAVVVSLKDLSVLEWIRYDSVLFWNLFWLFTAQVCCVVISATL